MKRARVLIFSGLSFAVGALLATRGEHDALRTALRAHAPDSTPAERAATASGAAEERTIEERFGQVLSAVQERSYLKRRHDLREAIGELSAAEVATMIERAVRLPENMNYPLTMALLERWFELDAERARAWVRARPRDWHFWKVWAAKDPETVIAEVHAMLNPLYRGAVGTLETAIVTLAGPDKKAQATRLAALPADSARDQLFAKTMAEWAKTDAASAFAFARSLPAGPLRGSITENALREWANTDPRRAAQEVRALLPELAPGLTGNGTIAAVAAALSKQDPQLALRWLCELPEEQRGSAPYVAAASAWAKTQPLEALAWCRENGVDAAGGGAAVMVAAMESEPLETVQWVQTLPPGEERDRLLERAISSGGKLTFPPVTEANSAVVMGLLGQLPPDAQERAAYQLGWSSGHAGKLEDVRVWTERLTDPAARAAAVEAAVGYRYGANPGNREKLLEQFPDGPERDGALAGIAAREREQSPARAVQTAFEIADPMMRHNVLDSVLGDWIERSPAQARAWLTEAKTLPAQWKDAWLAEASAPR